MFQIQLDAVVKEAVTMILGAVLYSQNGALDPARDDLDDRSKTDAMMAILVQLVIQKAVSHRLDKKGGVDEFLSTDLPIKTLELDVSRRGASGRSKSAPGWN